ncbi:MAG: VWA domain-containing protein [Bryobacteraceae bacterium]
MLRGSLLAVFGMCGLAFAQTPQPQQGEPQPAPIRVQVNEVIVPVTVTDSKGAFISNLGRSDFRIFENGREQKIVYFSRERDQPVVAGFLLDLSSSSRVHWKAFQNTAMELVWMLLSEDRQRKYSGFLVTYSTDAELAVDTTQDPEPIVDKIRRLRPGGGAALLDAIYLGITRHHLIVGEPIEPRRVLIVIGDGNDNASKHSIDEIIELAQRSLVTIYGVSTTAFGFASAGDATLRRLADETGGRVEYPLENVYKDVSGYLSKPQDAGNYALTVGSGEYAAAISSNMFDAIVKVAGEVTTQYILRYVPDTSDTTRQFRSVRVDVPGLADVKVRARRGYYPFAP